MPMVGVAAGSGCGGIIAAIPPPLSFVYFAGGQCRVA